MKLLYYIVLQRRKQQKYTVEPHGVFYVLSDYSAGTMAPLGQVSLQEPQSKQALASMM